jgi:hypothetical protein
MEFEQSPRDCIELSSSLMEWNSMVPVDWNTKSQNPSACPPLVIPPPGGGRKPLTPGVQEPPGEEEFKVVELNKKK